MNVSNFNRAVGLCAGAAILAACGASQPSSTPGAMRESTRIGTRADHRGSWMAPRAKGRDLLYVSNWNNNTVTVYTYPNGDLVGTLDGFTQPYGECVDKAGDVFIANDNAADILEYPHGSSSPIATISDAGEHPAGCSIDPITGDLAVNNAYTVGNEAGSISLYKHAPKRGWGFPKTYSDSKFFYMYFCGYDNKGDLFVDGYTAYDGSFVFAVLPAGHATFTNLKLDQYINVPGGVQWDGHYMTIGDSGLTPTVVYRFELHNDIATVVGSTSLGGPADVVQYWIEGSKIVGPEPKASTVGLWSYPAGGSAIRTITNGVDGAGGLTVSPGKASR